MELTVENTFAAPVIPGVEDKFYYVISEDCVMCASCAEACPVQGGFSSFRVQYGNRTHKRKKVQNRKEKRKSFTT